MTKRNLVSLLLLLAVAMLFAITRPWLELQLIPSAAAHGDVTVTGTAGNKALMPVAIALLAIGAVLGIAGRALRVALGALTAVFGGWIAWSAFAGVLGGQDAEIDFAKASIAEATGILSSSPIEVVDLMQVTVWPTVTVVLGLLVLLVGIGVAVFGWNWAQGGKRYEAKGSPREKKAPRPDGSADRIADWDALSEGDDPSDELGPEDFSGGDDSAEAPGRS